MFLFSGLDGIYDQKIYWKQVLINLTEMIRGQGYIDQKIICSQDEFYKVGQSELKSVYHRSIGALGILDKMIWKLHSTGVLLSKNIVLTAASSIYDKRQKSEYKGLQFYLPEKGIGKHYYEVESIRYHEQYATASPQDMVKFDYALLKLKGQVNYKQFPPILLPCSQCLNYEKETCLEIYGFPIYKNNFHILSQNSQFVLEQYGTSKQNALLSVNQRDNKISYAINTMDGHGGSPIMIKDKLVGIHLGGGRKLQNFNIGRLFEQQFVVNVYKMCAQMKGDQVKVSTPQTFSHKHFLKDSRTGESSEKFIAKMGKQEAKMGKMGKQEAKINKQEATIGKQEAKMGKQEAKMGKMGKMGKQEAKTITQGELQSTTQKSFIDSRMSLSKNMPAKQQSKSLRLLDLRGQSKFKLTEEGMILFSQAKLPYLADLNLDDNMIEDEGLQILCRNIYPQLQKVSLNDNAITINGLKFILFNKWAQNVQYQLYSVQSNDYGYYLHVGESLPIMKKMVKKQDIHEVDYLIPFEVKKIFHAINLFLLTPLDHQNPQKIEYDSKQLQSQYTVQSLKNPYSLATVLLQFKRIFGRSLNLSRKSDIKSRISSKIIFKGMSESRVRFTTKLQQFEQFQFAEFKCNYKRLIEFQRQYMDFLQDKYNVSTKEMLLEKINEGSIQGDTSDIESNTDFYSRDFFRDLRIDVRRYFQNLKLSQQQFEKGGNYSFPQINKAQVQSRGGLPYYQPVLGKRFGIKVNMYGNNNWLKMDGNKDQWAIAFHGVNKPKNIMKSIMQGRLQGTMLKVFPNGRHACKDHFCLKDSRQKVGVGIYITPYFLESLIKYSQVDPGQKFHLVLQCRANPEPIKFSTRRPYYWVINQSKYLRPYGVILFSDQDIKRIKQILESKSFWNIFRSSNQQTPQNIHRNIYKQQFNEDTWKKTYKRQFQSFKNKKND